MKVLVFGSFAASLVGFRGNLIAELVRRGHRVFAMAPDIDAATAAALRALGAEPVDVPLARSSLDPREGRRALQAVRERFAAVRPDLVLAYTIKPILLSARALRGTSGRLVALITGLGYAFLPATGLRHRLVRTAARLLYRRALRRASAIIFQNPDDRAEFASLGLLPDGVPAGVVNGSGIDLARFAPQPVPDQPHFLMIARLLRAKGVAEYAAAARLLKAERPHVRVSLAGWRDEGPDAISRADLAALEGDIDFLGRLEDVRPALAACSVYVLPSYREGTPRSVLEAMAAGRAVITTDVPGCRETVVDGVNGLLVPARDPQALFRAMLRLADDPALRRTMGAASRRIAEEKFDAARVTAATLELAGL